VPLGEFDIIARYFARTTPRDDVLLGVGDDAALLMPPPGRALVAATDTLVEGRHFLPGTPSASVGHNALAVNLSDLAAMGADPAWALLSLSMPDADEPWLEGFARGLHALASRHGVALVGGDTVSGPRVVTVAVLGFVAADAALRRDGARPGDAIFVSGTPGLAAAGLELLRDGRATFDSDDPRVRRFLYAEPRLALAKLATASGVGARLELERLPIPPLLAEGHDRAQAERYVLHGGDDYELLFTLPGDAAEAWAAEIAAEADCAVHRIGEIVTARGVTGRRDGRDEPVSASGHDHFAR
jgi:thiamine-monophosphate kinase